MSQQQRIECFLLVPTGRMVWTDDRSIGSPVWRDPRTGEEFHSGFLDVREGLRAVQLGAMRLYDDLYPQYRGADGKTLVVRVPGIDWPQDWIVDGRWQRTGESPTFSATPSLKIDSSTGEIWHGYLKNGVLEPC